MNINLAGIPVSVSEDSITELFRQRILGADGQPIAGRATVENFPNVQQRIGVFWKDQLGVYAGMARARQAGHNEDSMNDYALVVGEESPKGLNWKTGMEWAKDAGKDWRVPYRKETALCFATVPELFKNGPYWTCEPYEANDAGAWAQHFVDGGQNVFHKSLEFRVRLVRSVIVFF